MLGDRGSTVEESGQAAKQRAARFLHAVEGFERGDTASNAHEVVSSAWACLDAVTMEETCYPLAAVNELLMWSLAEHEPDVEAHVRGCLAILERRAARSISQRVRPKGRTG